MSIIHQIKSFIQRPFPQTEKWRNRLLVAIIVALFVTFFLYVFEPFGLSNVREGKFLISLGFGATTLASSIVYEIMMVKVFKLYDNLQTFTFWKWVLQTIGLILTISIANFLFGRWLHGNLDWRFLPNMIYATFAIGVFPTVVLGSISMLRQERIYQEIATNINSHSAQKNQKNQDQQRALGDIPVYSIGYIESYQNYIKVGYIDASGNTQESMQRATLKSMQTELENTSVVKCHRSFLVNRDNVLSVSGNAQGLLLDLEGFDKKIPVSRSFVSVFR